MCERDYWPEGERFGVLCVSGYDDRAIGYGAHDRGESRHGFAFYVVDLNRMGEVVRTFTGGGKKIDAHLASSARRKAVALVDKWNAKEAKCLLQS